MKIYIKSADGKVIKFPLPMSLVNLGLSCGNLGIRISKKHVDAETIRYLEAIDFKMLKKSFSELRNYKGLKLVDIKSSTGEEVRITI